MKMCSNFHHPYSNAVALCLFSPSAGTVNIFRFWNFTLKLFSYLVLISVHDYAVMSTCWKGECGFSFLSQSLPSKNSHSFPDESSLG